MRKFLDSPYWDKDVNGFSLFMGFISMVILVNIMNYIDLMILKIIAFLLVIVFSIIVVLITHFIINIALDYINNNMGEKKVFLKFLGIILIFLDILIFIGIISWSIYESVKTGEYIVLIGIPTYFFLYYMILSAPILGMGAWLFDNIEINSDKKDLKGEV